MPRPVRPLDQLLYFSVRGLVAVSNVTARRPHIGARTKRSAATRDQSMASVIGHLTAAGILDLRGNNLTSGSAPELAPTGSDIHVAIIPGATDAESRVVRFTDSVVASAELLTASAVQKELTADARLSSLSWRIPQVLASGVVGSTTYTIEEFLSSRDDRTIDEHRAAPSVLIASALTAIDEFHRATADHHQVDAEVLAAVVDRPINVLRANTPPGPFHCRTRAIDQLSKWLRRSLLGVQLNVGWTHGDFHLGNVLLTVDSDVRGVIDWGRAESDGLTVLDGCTLVAFERAKQSGKEFSAFLLELLSDAGPGRSVRRHSDVLDELRTLCPESGVDLRCLILLTWLKHVANNLKNEDRTRSHALWRLRTVDLLLFGSSAIVGL